MRVIKEREKEAGKVMELNPKGNNNNALIKR